MTEYLVVYEITSSRPLTDDVLTALTDALLDITENDPSTMDPDLAASIGGNAVDIQMVVRADDPAAAGTKALCTIRSAIHATGGATPGWETAQGTMRITPADAADPLLTGA